MDRGYLALWRKVQDHPFYKERREFSRFEAWVDILMEAQHKIESQDVLLGLTVFKCNYGESLKSLDTWALRWGWTKSKVRRYFKLLEKLNQIVTKNEKKTTRLTVLNYKDYDPKATRQRHASDTPATPDKNDKNEKKEIHSRIILYLNKKTGKHYKPNSKITIKLINARLNEGFQPEDFKTVIDNKTAQWGGDPKNNIYLRPETLFGPKFESYLNETPVNGKKLTTEEIKEKYNL